MKNLEDKVKIDYNKKEITVIGGYDIPPIVFTFDEWEQISNEILAHNIAVHTLR